MATYTAIVGAIPVDVAKDLVVRDAIFVGRVARHGKTAAINVLGHLFFRRAGHVGVLKRVEKKDE